MKKHLRVQTRILLQWTSTFLALLIIITGLQFIIRVNAVDIISSVTEIFPGSNSSWEEYRTRISLELGLDRPFMPDFYPLDDRSWWENPMPPLDACQSSPFFCPIIVWLELTFSIFGIIFIPNIEIRPLSATTDVPYL